MQPQDDNSPMDPKENPEGTDHLPVAGESGVGRVPDPDPLTTDTNDDPTTAPSVTDDSSDGDTGSDMNTPTDQLSAPGVSPGNVDQLGNRRTRPGPDPDQIRDDQTIGDPGVL